MTGFEEKRKYQRIGFSAPLEIVDLRNNQMIARGLVCNISGGGLGIELDTSLSAGTDYRFLFSFSDGKKFKVLGKIMWSFMHDKGILHGVKFLRLGLLKRWMLNKIVNRYKKQG